MERPGILEVTSTVVDDALLRGASVYHPHRLELLDESRPFDMRIRAVTSGPVTIGVLSYADPVRLETDDMKVAYEVNVPLVGELACSAGSDTFVATPERAALFGPEGSTSMTGFGHGRPLLGVKLDRDAVERKLAELTGSARPLQASPVLDLTTSHGKDWWLLLRSLMDMLTRDNDGASLLTNALVMRPLTDGLLTGLLLAADHPRLPELLEPVAPSVPASVHRAQEIIHERAGEAMSVSDLARATGMSVRGLQAAFRHHLEMTPMDYVRRVRMSRAHADLLAADPARTTVADVAHRWGFTHVGRFASRYRAVYGTPPSSALRSGG